MWWSVPVVVVVWEGVPVLLVFISVGGNVLQPRVDLKRIVVVVEIRRGIWIAFNSLWLENTPSVSIQQ